MRRAFATAVALGLLLTAGVATSGASTKFSYSTEIGDDAGLILRFEEGSLKRFETVEYRLDGTATTQTPSLGVRHPDLTATVVTTTDARGRVAAELRLGITTTLPTVCGCGPLQVDYFDLTLTNVTTGKVYRLAPVGRTFT